ncbi:DNA-binding domain-containing protein [Caulobacter sp. 1776]|uniref:DNA-binding domain-containing protein n=1 Tax=Caulobacter sp. 1776 TaxID=3156420 RepID=UPI0033973228
MSLLALQRGLRDHILAEAGEAPMGVASTAGPGLAVYHHAYRAQLVACLRDTFEKTWAWLGDDGFDAAALAHILAHPPHGWTLAAYGFDFPETLTELYPDDPEVAELAWLDWALRRAFDGADAAPITQEELAEMNWDTVVLALTPTLAVREVSTNCAALWTALAEEKAPPPIEQLPAGAAIRVWRQDLSPQYRTIDGLELEGLSLALQGVAFAVICETMAQGQDDAAQRMGGLLGAWLQDRLIVSAR